ncbi:MAG: hypothetical protein HQL46_02915 [Gammaproteobacteria bacterium]|nr:hypothetical protein [Gammaproteobacteria bacterium]
MFKQISILILVAFVYPLTNAYANEGRELHNSKCLSCHQTEAYTRANHKVKSSLDLGRQVSMCSQNLNTEWFPDDEKEVVNFLNDNFYHFTNK